MKGLRSSAAELSCVDTTDMIFSWKEKEILGVQDNNDQARQHRFTDGKDFGHRRGSSPSIRELEEGFNDSVKEIRSILQTQEVPLMIPWIGENANLNMDQKCDAEPQSNEGTQFKVQEKCLEKLM